MAQITVPGHVNIANITVISRMFLLWCAAILAWNLSYASDFAADSEKPTIAFTYTAQDDESIRAAFDAYDSGKLAEAFKLLKRTAIRKDRRAEFLLGEMYAHGDSALKEIDIVTQRETKIAASWYRKAATQGLPEAQAKMGCMFEIAPFPPEEGYKWALAGTMQGNAEATGCLAIMYFWGENDNTGQIMAPKDQKKAIALFEKAAQGGDPLAQENLADLYWYGKIDHSVKEYQVAIDKSRAIELYIKAAEGGKQQSMERLKTIYNAGEEVEKNPVMSYVWRKLYSEYMHENKPTPTPTDLTNEQIKEANNIIAKIRAKSPRGVTKYRDNQNIYPKHQNQ